MIDQVRAYWNRRPCNIRHSDLPVGTREYFDEVEERKYFVEPHIPAFADFRRWRGKNVLEIGCGIGTDTINFARAGALVVAVDISRKSLVVAQKRAKVFKLDNKIWFRQINAETYLPPCTPDLIYSFGVLHHTPHPDLVLRHMVKYARPGGTEVRIMLYYRYSWKALTLWLRRGGLSNSEAQSGCPITRVYSKHEARRLLEDNGIRVRRMYVEHIFPYKVKDYVNHKYTKVWYFRWMPRFLFRWLERHFGWHLCIEAEI